MTFNSLLVELLICNELVPFLSLLTFRSKNNFELWILMAFLFWDSCGQADLAFTHCYCNFSLILRVCSYFNFINIYVAWLSCFLSLFLAIITQPYIIVKYFRRCIMVLRIIVRPCSLEVLFIMCQFTFVFYYIVLLSPAPMVNLQLAYVCVHCVW